MNQNENVNEYKIIAKPDEAEIKKFTDEKYAPALFKLYEQLIPQLKDVEYSINKKSDIKRRIYELENIISKKNTTPFIIAFYGMKGFSIPFIIIFIIASNFIHTKSGQAFFKAYNIFWNKTFLFSWAPESIKSAVDFIKFILSWLLKNILIPEIFFLLPVMIIIGILGTAYSIKKNKKILSEKYEELNELEQELKETANVVGDYVAYIPPDYCNSTALEFFCNSWQNHKVSNLKEAVNLYDDYIHRKKMESGQNQILEAMNTYNYIISSIIDEE